MTYEVYWRSRDRKQSGKFYIEASNRERAYDIAMARLGNGYEVVAAYEA